MSQFKNPDLDEANIQLEEIFGNEAKVSEFISMFFIGMIDNAYISYTLYFAALVTIQHSSLTRYPDFKKNINPIDLYNYKLPTIKKQNDFMDLLESALNRLTKVEIETLK